MQSACNLSCTVVQIIIVYDETDKKKNQFYKYHIEILTQQIREIPMHISIYNEKTNSLTSRLG